MDRAEVVVERRTPEGWRAKGLSGLEAVVALPVLGIELPLEELYERVPLDRQPPTATVG